MKRRAPLPLPRKSGGILNFQDGPSLCRSPQNWGQSKSGQSAQRKKKKPPNRREGGAAIKIVGRITEQVEQLLGIAVPGDRAIYLGQTNLDHMRSSHPEDFAKYGADLITILAYPDYVGQNPTDGSIEYVKEFLTDGEYVKVAVRLAQSERYYARSLYILNNRRVKNFIDKGTLKKI